MYDLILSRLWVLVKWPILYLSVLTVLIGTKYRVLEVIKWISLQSMVWSNLNNESTMNLENQSLLFNEIFIETYRIIFIIIKIIIK